VLNMFRSNNGGSSWTTLTGPAGLNNGGVSQTWYNLTGAVDPNNADIIVAGGLNLVKSTDGGSNWTTITGSGTVHVDHHIVLFSGSSALLNGNDGGIYYSSNINAGSPSFTNKNNGYNVTQYYGCDLHPSLTNYFLAGAQDNGTQKFTVAGINTTSNATGGDGGFPHIDQTDGQLQISSNTANNFNRSLNGGTTFSSLGGTINNNRGQFINPTDLDDVQKTLYAGDDAGKYYCISGLNGTPSAQQITVAAMGTREVTAVKVDASSSNTIWLGASFGTPAAAPVVLKLSTANTATPTVLVNTTLSVVANSAISSIDIDPANANHILVTLSSYGVVSVWESTDGGNVFNNIEGNLPDMPVRWGMFAPANAQLNGTGGGNGGVLLGTELGVWTTSQINGTSTVWIPNNAGLANVRTDMLKYRASDNTVAAATHGRGLFTSILPTVVTGIGNPGNTKDFIKYISADNNRLLIVAGNLSTKAMTIGLFNMSGQKVKELSGKYENISVDISRLSAGMYVLKCTGDKKESYVQKFVK
jgi:Secretion system C-terminal sorting domain